jgi:hypothetical protein
VVSDFANMFIGQSLFTLTNTIIRTCNVFGHFLFTVRRALSVERLDSTFFEARLTPALVGLVSCRIRSNWSPGPSPSHIATDGPSVCLSWCEAPAGAHDQIFFYESYCPVHLGRLL